MGRSGSKPPASPASTTERESRFGRVAVFKHAVGREVRVEVCSPWHDGQVIEVEYLPCEACGSRAAEGCSLKDCPSRPAADGST
jgi:hypothetical protein